MASSQAKADAAKAALASTATCTTAIVVTLKELLLPDTDALSGTSQKPTRTARTTVNPKTKKATGATTTTAKPSDDQLSAKERLALATHVVNITVKSLADAAKPAPPSTPTKRQASQTDLRKAAGSRKLRRSLSAPLSPLPSRTLNRVATSPNISSKTSSQPQTLSTGCLATVECARVAFACLRVLMGPVKPAQTDLQVENGMSAFIGKLISLGLQDQALKESRILKRRLDTSDKPMKATPSEPQTASQVVVELIDYTEPIPKERLAIITTCQVQVLRLISLSRKPAQIEAVLPLLDQTHHSSPLKLLQRFAEHGEKEAQKAARQLASLSQILLALAPSVTSKEDQVATEPRLSPSPASAFKLQVLCFTAQLIWWKLAGHEGNLDNEVLSPFARCIRAYTRRQPAGDFSPYDSIASSFNDIMCLVKTSGLEPKSSSDSPLASIYQLLGAAAHTDRQYTSACGWLQSLKELMVPADDPFVRICSATARLLAATLKKPKHDSHADQLAQEIVEGLDGNLSGNLDDLNELLESLSLARRSAVGVLATVLQSPDSDGVASEALIDSLKNLVMRFPRFCRRWLGNPPGKDASAKHHLQYDQRRQLLMQSVNQVLDGTLNVVNAEIRSKTMTWRLLDDVLCDSCKLVETIVDPLMSVSRSEQMGTYYVKISSLYFARYTQLRKDMGKSKTVSREVLQSLYRSIEMIQDRPMAQQEKAQLSTKLEVYADLCKATGRGDEAVKTLRLVCTNMIEEGALVKVTAALASQPPSVAWCVDEKAEILSRTLRSIAKLDDSWNDWAFFLPEGERAAVLEHLMQVSGESSARGQPLKIHDPSVQALLRIYTAERFPIRRLRVLLHLLFQNIGEDRDLAEIRSLVDDAVEKVEAEAFAEDESLVRYVSHLQAYRKSVSALATAEAPFPATAMREAVSAWKSMIEACTSRAELYEKFDNPDGLLAHLQSASEFASLRGENSLQLCILQLTTPLAKILAEPTYNNVILNHTLLASQHLNIGHYAEAKETLQMTKELLDKAQGPSRGLVAGYHLAQAEFYSGVGNIEEA